MASTTNGTKGKGKEKVDTWTKSRIQRRARTALTILLGILLPLLSLTLSYISGRLFRAEQALLGTASLALMGCVLSVSLAHLAWAVKDITHSPRWASWALSITFALA